MGGLWSCFSKNPKEKAVVGQGKSQETLSVDQVCEFIRDQLHFNRKTCRNQGFERVYEKAICMFCGEINQDCEPCLNYSQSHHLPKMKGRKELTKELKILHWSYSFLSDFALWSKDENIYLYFMFELNFACSEFCEYCHEHLEVTNLDKDTNIVMDMTTLPNYGTVEECFQDIVKEAKQTSDTDNVCILRKRQQVNYRELSTSEESKY